MVLSVTGGKRMGYDAMEVANYIVSQHISMNKPITNMKLQKLLYLQVSVYNCDIGSTMTWEVKGVAKDVNETLEGTITSKLVGKTETKHQMHTEYNLYAIVPPHIFDRIPVNTSEETYWDDPREHAPADTETATIQTEFGLKEVYMFSTTIDGVTSTVYEDVKNGVYYTIIVESEYEGHMYTITLTLTDYELMSPTGERYF